MTEQLSRLNARAFTEANLAQLSEGILYWRMHAALPADSTVHKLASICRAFTAEGDEYQEAERLTITRALEQAVSDSPVPPQTVHDEQASKPEHPGGGEAAALASRERLLSKLSDLMPRIEAMSDDEYGDWINALPQDDFFEFVGLDDEALASTAAAAKKLMDLRGSEAK
ncbi:hypothetical protein [Stutzerimonas stutzeri]|uniref:hypothetical protein n=1 Tax=Stutzerimonas stutzeri TaxID=316 RepID=UPI0015E2ED95|nr:hypothetical protein [Stutzerimonas stutzeri]MBA1280336.1 hypothetical protein [Stutzerimonas stutzeri]